MADERPEEALGPGEVATAHYGWTKPAVGASGDVWGAEWNTDLDGIDTTVYGIQQSVPGPATATPAMDGTGAVGVSALFARADHVHPTDTSRYAASNPNGYQTAAQVSAAVPAASTTTPLIDGTAAVGTGTTWARADHVHPTDTTRAAASALASYLPLAGGTLTGALVPSQTAGLTGTTTNNNANAGAVGEHVQADQVSNVTLVTTTAKNVTSISLTAGDWDVEGNVYFNPSVGATVMEAGISTVSNTLPTGTTTWLGLAVITGPSPGLSGLLPTGGIRLLLASTTTVYLVALAAFSSGTCPVQGSIRARRRR